ncbi:MAG: tetratricopeptide repeat protein, partial [Winogradskyella sp.]|uniref:tetratricopeptide repeat protein n=1 Tax=Winogradskyella sp. TaxID=1883156 RepID=UPI00181037F9|nr:tetratricopeptide repeat protein [Winogradskyella sp.]
MFRIFCFIVFGLLCCIYHTTQTEQSKTAQISILKEEIRRAESPLIEQLKDSLATIYSKSADDFIANKNYKDAINNLLKAVPLYEATANLNALSSCYSRLGSSYYRVSNYENSQLYYFKSLNLEESLGNKKGIAINLEKIGEIYLLTMDLDKATINFKQAIEIYKSLNDEKGIIYN